jgi:formylglycine-generating enzyme required for sulfatase activity
MKSRVYVILTIFFTLLMTSFSLAQDKNEKYQARPGMTIDQIKEIQKGAAEYFSIPVHMSLKLTEEISIDLVLIPPGAFYMGSRLSQEETARKYQTNASLHDLEHPRHLVRISKPFYIGKYEITQLQWDTIMEGNPSPVKGNSLPVEMVSWDQAQKFCNIVSKKTGRTVRLSTEAEWEHACRAGTETDFYFGDELTDKQANMGNNHSHSVAVGSYPPNAWGVHDMHGNVVEWVNDGYGFYSSEQQTDPTGAPPTSYSARMGRMLRGGGYASSVYVCRSAFRYAHLRSAGDQKSGFRIVVPLNNIKSK